MALPPSIAVAQILGLDGTSAVTLEPLATFFSATDAETESALAGVASAFAGGVKPTLLADEILGRAELLQLFRHEREPNWQYGKFGSRKKLTETLLTRARAASAASAGRTDSARAALVVAAQDPFCCVPSMHWLIMQSDFEELSRWPASDLEEVKVLLVTEVRKTGTFYEAVMVATKPLGAIIGAGANSVARDDVISLLATMHEMSNQATHRPELQWRLANFAWRLAVLSRARAQPYIFHELTVAVDAWRRDHQAPHLDRWFDEALTTDTTDIKTVGFSVKFTGRLRRATDL